MNAWATYVAGTWLMGECEVNDVELFDADSESGVTTGKNQGLLVKRCRFLEEAGCASVCVNSCKIPTQNFFLHDHVFYIVMIIKVDIRKRLMRIIYQLLVVGR